MAAVSFRAWGMAILESSNAMAATSRAAISLRLPRTAARTAASVRVRRRQFAALRAVHRNAGIDPATAAIEGNAWDETTEVAEAEWSEPEYSTEYANREQRQGEEEYSSEYAGYEQQQVGPEYSSEYANYEQQQDEQPKEPPKHFDNCGKPLNFIAMGRAMQLTLNSQKDFEMFLEKCNAYGVMIPEEPTKVRSNLCELDPRETWIVCDTRALLKFAKKMALEEAAKNPNDYPPGFVEDMLNRDKYGRYKSDDDDD